MSDLSIGRGWTVFSSDGKRVGDVTEVHPHYILVSRGILRIKDMFMPLGTVDRIDGATVILTVTYEALRQMNLSREPAPTVQPDPEPLHDPDPAGYTAGEYPSEVVEEGEPIAFPGTWAGESGMDEETPSYSRPLVNGLIEVEHALNLAYHDLGYGSPIIMLQGWPFDSTVWEPLPVLLAEDHRVITYDMRGTGDSDKPWDYYSLDVLVHDLHRVVIEQSLRDITLVAWSTAAAVALDYAREHPARVTRVVLLAPVILQWLDPSAPEWQGPAPDLDRTVQEAWAAQLVDDRPALFERLVDWLTAAPLSGPRRNWIWQRLMHGAPHAQAKLFAVFREYDPMTLLPEIKAPVTILRGEQDRIAPPAVATRLNEQLSRCQIVTVSDCGHAIFLERRDIVSRAILDLIEASNGHDTTVEDTMEPDGDHDQDEGEGSETVNLDAEAALLMDSMPSSVDGERHD